MASIGHIKNKHLRRIALLVLIPPLGLYVISCLTVGGFIKGLTMVIDAFVGTWRGDQE